MEVILAAPTSRTGCGALDGVSGVRTWRQSWSVSSSVLAISIHSLHFQLKWWVRMRKALTTADRGRRLPWKRNFSVFCPAGESRRQSSLCTAAHCYLHRLRICNDITYLLEYGEVLERTSTLAFHGGVEECIERVLLAVICHLLQAYATGQLIVPAQSFVSKIEDSWAGNVEQIELMRWLEATETSSFAPLQLGRSRV